MAVSNVAGEGRLAVCARAAHQCRIRFRRQTSPILPSSCWPANRLEFSSRLRRSSCHRRDHDQAPRCRSPGLQMQGIDDVSPWHGRAFGSWIVEAAMRIPNGWPANTMRVNRRRLAAKAYSAVVRCSRDTASRPSPATLLTVIGGRRLLPKPPIGAGASDHRDECQTGDYHARVCLPWRRGNRRRRSGANFGLGRNERRYPFILGGCRIRRWRWSVCHVARPWMRIL